MNYRTVYFGAVAWLLFQSPVPADVPVDASSRAALEELEHWLAMEPAVRPTLSEQPFARVPLTRADASAASGRLWDDHVEKNREQLRKEWEAGRVRAGEHEMKFEFRVFGEKPVDGWDLFISLHGGGGAPAHVNERQWRNQVDLYKPGQGIYVAPRAPTDAWNMWHQAHMDGLLDRLVKAAVMHAGANPNRVYVMGYSAGGDGVYQLAPRMADRWAAAAMMAGHPNETSPLGLRNIGFTIHVGERDGAYDRNKVAAAWKEKLETLRAADPGGYAHHVELHATGHWMNLEDAVALEWMAAFTRNTLPGRVVWKQDDVTHSRFYWLAVPDGQTGQGAEIVAQRDGQTIVIARATGVDNIIIRLNDEMLDLDETVTVLMDGQPLFSGRVPRTIATLFDTLSERADAHLVFPSQLTVSLTDPQARKRSR